MGGRGNRNRDKNKNQQRTASQSSTNSSASGSSYHSVAKSSDRGGGFQITLPSEVSIPDDVLTSTDAMIKYMPTIITDLRKLTGVFEELVRLQNRVAEMEEKQDQSLKIIEQMQKKIDEQELQEIIELIKKNKP